MKKSMMLVKLHSMKSEIELLIQHFEDESALDAQNQREVKEGEEPKSCGKRWLQEEDDIIIKAANDKNVDIDDITVELAPDRTKASVMARVYSLGMRVHYNRILTSPKGLKV